MGLCLRVRAPAAAGAASLACAWASDRANAKRCPATAAQLPCHCQARCPACPQIYELLTYHYVEDDDNMFRWGWSQLSVAGSHDCAAGAAALRCRVDTVEARAGGASTAAGLRRWAAAADCPAACWAGLPQVCVQQGVPAVGAAAAGVPAGLAHGGAREVSAGTGHSGSRAGGSAAGVHPERLLPCKQQLKAPAPAGKQTFN